jgi:hypothetical protein
MDFEAPHEHHSPETRRSLVAMENHAHENPLMKMKNKRSSVEINKKLISLSTDRRSDLKENKYTKSPPPPSQIPESTSSKSPSGYPLRPISRKYSSPIHKEVSLSPQSKPSPLETPAASSSTNKIKISAVTQKNSSRVSSTSPTKPLVCESRSASRATDATLMLNDELNILCKELSVLE